MSETRPVTPSNKRPQVAKAHSKENRKRTGQAQTLPKDVVNKDEKTPASAAGSSAQSSFARPLARSSKSSATPKANTDLLDAQTTNMEMEDLRNRLKNAENAREASERDLAIVKNRIDSLQTDYGQLEERLAMKSSELDSKDATLNDLAHRLKTSEQKAEEERAKLFHEQTRFSEKHDEMSDTIQRLHQRTSSMTSSPRIRDSNGAEDVESRLHSRTNSNNALLALQMSVSSKDRQIHILEEDVNSLKQEVSSLTQSGIPDLERLEHRVEELVLENDRLREDIDGYQILLQDKTVSGEFASSHFMQSTSSNSKYQSMRGPPNGIDLASELDSVSLHSIDRNAQSIEVAGRADLEAEVLKLQESNKALTLYVNTIVARMLNTQGFEHLLAKDASDMEPLNPVPARNTIVEAPAPSFLQRTKSVLSRKAPISKIENPAPDLNRLRPVTEREDDRRTSSETNSYGNFQRNVDDSLRRAKSPAKSSSKSPVSTPKGLRPLASNAAADRFSPSEARRLSAQFAPAMLPSSSEVKEAFGPPLVTDKKAKRSSWMGWLGKEKEGSSAKAVEDIKPLQRIEDLKPLEEIDQEIEREAEQ